MNNLKWIVCCIFIVLSGVSVAQTPQDTTLRLMLEPQLPDIKFQVKEFRNEIPSQTPFTLKCTSNLPNGCTVEWELQGKKYQGKEVTVNGLPAGKYTVTCTIKRNNQVKKLPQPITVINKEGKTKTETKLPEIKWQVKEFRNEIPSQTPFTLRCTSDLPNDCTVQWDLNGKQYTGKEVRVTPGLPAGKYQVTCKIKLNNQEKSLTLPINVINKGF